MTTEDIPSYAMESIDLATLIAFEQLKSAQQIVGANLTIDENLRGQAAIALAQVMATNYLAITTERGLVNAAL